MDVNPKISAIKPIQKGKLILSFLLLSSMMACSLYQFNTPSQAEISAHYPMDESGRDTFQNQFANLYASSSLQYIDFPKITDSLMVALQHHKKLLKIRKQKKIQVFDNLEISVQDMERTIETLIQLQQHPDSLENLVAYQIAGQKKSGNVKFTGYYTPLIQVSKKKTSTYKYPIYAKPHHFIGKMPTRKAIEFEGILENQGLELAYAKNRLDIYFMQVQGSGYVQFRDGSTQTFGYGGSNGHPYRSIGRFLKMNDYKISNISEAGIKEFFKKRPDLVPKILPANPSYSFFKPRDTPPKGAGHVPLSGGISVAVDRRYIPLGATAIASIPRYDELGDLIGHELKILLAQDVGGAIKGAGHIDLYMGDERDAREVASQYYHYGKLWLLMPKGSSLAPPVTVSNSEDVNI